MSTFALASTLGLFMLATTIDAQAGPPAAPANSFPLGQFYAYGQGIDGLPIFSGNGQQAFVGNAPSNMNNAADVTFFEDPSGPSPGSSLPVAANNDPALSNALFYIDSDGDGLNPAGFAAPNAATDGATTTGFKLYGSELMWIGSSGELEEHWWAIPSQQDDMYTLAWDGSGAGDANAIPVIVKNVAPTDVGGS